MKKIKNFFQKNFFLDVKNNLKKSFKKFPISFISIILIFGILEFLVLKGNFLSENLQNILGKLILSLSIVAILGVGIKFFLEDKMGICLGKSCKIKKKIIGFSPIIFGILFFVNFEGSLLKNFYFEDFLYIFISIFLAVCFLFVSKFLKIKKIENGKMLDGEYKNSEYIHFLNGQIGKIGISFLAGFILMILGFIAFSAVFALFDLLDFLNKSKVFGFWSVFSFGFFAPIYFLVKNSEKKSENSQNIFFEFLTKFLFLPSIFIYFIILFAYSAKILLNFQNWPNGVISWLIIFFSTFGYLVYAEIFQLSAKNNFAKIFKKFFPFAVLLQMPMFFYAIFLRINQYDWTINRYLLVGLGLYFTVISLYFIISKNKKLVNIFWILFLFLSFISFSGPFSVYKFPENQQLKILEKNLIEAKILQNGKIILSKEDVPKKISGEIYHKIDYLCDFHGCDSMGKIMPEFLEEIKNDDKKVWEDRKKANIERFSKAIKEHGDEIERTKINQRKLKEEQESVYPGINSWDFKNQIIDKLKVENFFYINSKNSEFINVNFENNFNDFYKISGWDYFLRIRNKNDFLGIEKADNNKFYVEFDSKTEILKIFEGKKEVGELNFEADFKDFFEKNKSKIGKWGMIKISEPFVIEKELGKMKIKILLNNFSVKNYDFDGGKSDYFNGFVDGIVLLKIK